MLQKQFEKYIIKINVNKICLPLKIIFNDVQVLVFINKSDQN
jgi:hypothetical protein